MDFLTISVIIIICYLIYRYLTKGSKFFEKSGIPYLPGWPIIGNMKDLAFNRRHLSEIIKEIYYMNSDAKYVGLLDFREPVIVLRDLELIKDITIKNFDNFPDHNPFGEGTWDPLFDENLFNLMGERWRKERNNLNPSFTSSKIKIMFNVMVKCAENVVSFIENQPKESQRMFCAEDWFAKYANDVIAACAFGINVDSLRNPNNDFYILGRKATDLEQFSTVKLFLSKMFPGLMKFLNVRLFDKEITNSFDKLIRDAVLTNNEDIIRPNMIQMITESQKTSIIDMKQLTPQAFLFFFAGFDPVSNMICLMAHELTTNPDVQQKLQNEIDDVMKEYDGKPTFEAINGMIYLDAVFNEVNRLHGQGTIIDRVCKIPYELPPPLPGSKPVKIKPGMRIFIPTWSIQRDPNYFEDPDKFIPDRHIDKKVSTNNVLNLSFGIGPRVCIAKRFASLEIKILFVYLLAKFSLRSNERTCIPMKYSTRSNNVEINGGCWLSAVPRK